MTHAEHPFFTIVVPCCEVARYLAELAGSLKGQSFEDWECILSYEESSDETLASCEALVQGDPRFRLVKGPRSGSPATPRNRAFAEARGVYVVWLDGDDWLAHEALRRLADGIRRADAPVDLVQGGVTEYKEDARGRRTLVGRHFNFTAEDNGRILGGFDVLERFAARSYAWPMASLSVCRSAFLREQGLTFATGLKFEDEEWTPRAVTLARHILILDLDIFVYRRRAGSMTTSTQELTRLRHYARVAHSQFTFFAGQDLPPATSAAVARYYLGEFGKIFFWRNDEADATRPSPREMTDCLRLVLEAGGRRAIWKIARHTTPARRVGAFLLLFAGIHPLLDRLVQFYMRQYFERTLRRYRKQTAQMKDTP